MNMKYLLLAAACFSAPAWTQEETPAPVAEQAPVAEPQGPAPLVLPVAGVSLVLPAGAGAWKAEAQADPAGTADLLVRDAPGMPDLRVVLAVAPAGETCDGALGRLAKRGGLSLFDRPAWISARWNAKATDETDFQTGTQIQAICADVSGAALTVVVSNAGNLSELGGPDGQLGALLDAVAGAFETAAGTAHAFSASAPPQAAATSMIARLRFMADPASVTAALAARSGSFSLPAGAGVLVTLQEKVSSKKSEKGQKIKAKVTQDVVVDDAVLIKKGTPVEARVAEVDSASMGGSGGSLKIAIDSTKAVDGQTVALNYETTTKEGENTRGISVTGLFTGWGLLSHGKNVEIAEGTSVEAKTTTAMEIKAGD